jgi:hypothetical protein
MNIYDLTCSFQKISEHDYKCVYCGTKITSYELDHPVLLCSKKLDYYGPPEQFGLILEDVEPKAQEILEEKPNHKMPGFIDKVIGFGKAATQHLAKGNPKCTEEQIAERYDICKSCEFFQNNICAKCGCNLVREQIYMNKLAWADQSCPIGKWKAVR